VASDRLSPLDASFLHLEDESSHMHVAAVLIFDGQPPAYDDFVSFVDSRLHLVPRYRQRLAFVPLNQARPKWVDDEEFDPRFHIRATALPRPGGEYELQVLAARLFSRPLNRERPLWEMWLIEGLDGGRFAVMSKTHHALVDGISGLDLLSVLFSSDEESGEGDWRPRPSPGGAQMLGEALWERATMPAELLRPALALLRRPRRAAERVLEAAVGVGAMAWAGLNPAPATPYNRRVGGDRRFAWVRTELDDLKAIKNALGGTVNDVVLTVVARALRRDLDRRAFPIDGLELKVFVPISMRGDDERGQTGNLVSGMVVSLPVSLDDPVEVLQQIVASTRELKDSGQAVGAQALTELTGFAPPNVMDQAARLTTRQRFINLVVTNVPGPQEPLEMAGRRLTDLFPIVPLGKNLGLGVALISYNGAIDFGLVADFEAVPELEELAADFEAAIDELASAAGISRGSAADQPEAVASPVSLPPPEADSPAVAEHVDTEPELVSESAQPGAEDGAGAEVHVQEPWPRYDTMRAPDVIDRLKAAEDEVVAVVGLYENLHKQRRQVLAATERELQRR
jgi:WS/DGAT/MGAT family acyltransferase